MTPYEYVKVLAEAVGTLPGVPTGDPGRVLPQLGDIVVDCEGTWVSITNVSERDMFDGDSSCGTVEIGSVQVASAFSCSITSDDEGVTDPVKLAAVSAQQDGVGTPVSEWARDLIRTSFVRGSFDGVQYTNNGGLAVVVVSFSVPIP